MLPGKRLFAGLLRKEIELIDVYNFKLLSIKILSWILKKLNIVVISSITTAMDNDIEVSVCIMVVEVHARAYPTDTIDYTMN